MKERESETGVLIGVEIKAQTLSSHPLTSNPLSQIKRCSNDGDGVNCHSLCGENTVKMEDLRGWG